MNIRQPFCTIVADFTVQPLADFLKNDGLFPCVESAVAPFGQVTQSLIDLRMGRWKRKPDFAVVWTRPEITIPAFRALLNYEHVTIDRLLDEVDQFAELLLGVAGRIEYLFVITWVLPYYRRGLGLLSMRPDFGWAYALMRMNLRLPEKLPGSSNVYQLDASRWLAAVGKKASNPKLWLVGKVAFGLEVFQEASTDIKAGLCALAGLSRKLIVLDLDDTLWGDIVGEVGWENLKLGGHDPVGEAFVEFQQALKALTRTGILLGIVSKNDEATALAAMERHPEMVLRRPDFAGWRINWNDKAANIADLVAEFNLGLNSVVFIDDDPAERARVREALPEVSVPEWPVDKLLYARTLLEMRLFDKPVITEEDVARTEMYVSDGERSAEKQSFQSMAEWLRSLELVVKAETLNETNLTRAAQLLNKTNQMNLTTRRMGEVELLGWSRQERQRVFVFRISDRFGDYGLTGLAGLKRNGPHARITDFLLSCRVMGRGIEEAMLHVLVEYARTTGVREIEARYLPTARNRPCLEFFEERAGFHRGREEGCFTWDAEMEYPLPAHTALEVDHAI